MTDPLFAGEAEHIVALADRYKLPGIYGYREFAEAGGLMSYGLSYRDYFKGVSHYVDRVLKGVKPADLPVEQPTKIEFVINLTTAKKLGVKLPQELLVRADVLLGQH
jgi:putative ABC transport system substrate-binding protein